MLNRDRVMQSCYHIRLRLEVTNFSAQRKVLEVTLVTHFLVVYSQAG